MLNAYILGLKDCASGAPAAGVRLWMGTIYILSGFDGLQELLVKLGKHKTSKTCLYIKNISDVDLDVLEEIISTSVQWMKARQEVDQGPEFLRT